MQDLWPIVTSVLGVFLIIGIGGLCRRLDWLTPESDRSLASLAANVMLPAYFIHHILSSENFAALSQAWAPPAFGFVSTLAGFGIALLFSRVLGKHIGLDTDSKQRAFALCVGIANYGYIPLPLAEQFYPAALVSLILHNVGVDLALWSVGIAIISGTSDGGWKRAVLSAPFLAVIFAFTLRQLGWGQFIPTPIMNAVGGLGNCAIPLGLLLSGAMIMEFLSESSWSGSFRMVVAAITLRQGLMPALMLLATGAIAQTVELQQVMMLQAAMPVAIFPIVLVRLYHRDTETALRVILSTALAGVVLIPVWLAIGKWWLGI